MLEKELAIIKVYHGSPNRFNVFDYNKIGTNGTAKGFGFYFTDNKLVAKEFGKAGYLYTAIFIGNKHLSLDKLTIRRGDFKKYLLSLHDKSGYLFNWGDVYSEGLESVLNKAVELEYKTSKNDVDLIGGVVNASGDVKLALRTCYEVLGYDSIISTVKWGDDQTLYIALVEEAFELLTVQVILKEEMNAI